jgi:hypothetical protein
MTLSTVHTCTYRQVDRWGGLTPRHPDRIWADGQRGARPPLNLHHRVHPEWRLPISGVHPIISSGWWGWGCTPTPFQPIAITYAPAERSHTLSACHLYAVCALWFSLCDVYTELLRLKGLSPEIYSIIYVLGFKQDFLFVRWWLSCVVVEKIFHNKLFCFLLFYYLQILKMLSVVTFFRALKAAISSKKTPWEGRLWPWK